MEDLFCPECNSCILLRLNGTIVPHWSGGDDDRKCNANDRLLSDYIGSPEPPKEDTLGVRPTVMEWAQEHQIVSLMARVEMLHAELTKALLRASEAEAKLATINVPIAKEETAP